MENCTPCQIYEAKKGIIYEDDLFFSVFNIHPDIPGQAGIFTKPHLVEREDLFRYLNSEHVPFNPKKIKKTILPVELDAMDDTFAEIQCINLVGVYEQMIANPIDARSAEASRKMLQFLELGKCIDDYTVSIKDKQNKNKWEKQGRTYDHLMWNLRPTYS